MEQLVQLLVQGVNLKLVHRKHGFDLKVRFDARTSSASNPLQKPAQDAARGKPILTEPWSVEVAELLADVTSGDVQQIAAWVSRTEFSSAGAYKPEHFQTAADYCVKQIKEGFKPVAFKSWYVKQVADASKGELFAVADTPTQDFGMSL